jgi:hypothetical protein
MSYVSSARARDIPDIPAARRPELADDEGHLPTLWGSAHEESTLYDSDDSAPSCHRVVIYTPHATLSGGNMCM